MAKILGLDLGTNSLGWAVIDDEKNTIEKTGVRIFQEGIKADTIGQGDKEVSRNAERREHRQMRKQFYRKRLRKIKLLEVLIDQKMCPLTKEELSSWKNWNKTLKSAGREFPTSEAFTHWIQTNPYDLRDRAVREEITDYELGRICYHLIQRRGFLSNRKSSGEDAKGIYEKGNEAENIRPINFTKNQIEKGKEKTLGAYLSKLQYTPYEAYQSITEEGQETRIRGRYTTRAMYIEEFEKIWQTQAKFKDLDSKTVRAKRSRDLQGTLASQKNKKRIQQLKEKYGQDNTQVEVRTVGKEDKQKETLHITTYKTMPLKEFLGGQITVEDTEEGQKIKFKSDESVLFWQRPLRSQKGTLDSCQFEKQLPVIKKDGTYLMKNGEIQRRSKTPCPLSHPSFELFRSYQFVNNIKTAEGDYLESAYKQQIIDILNKKKAAVKFGAIIKSLKLTNEKFNYDDDFSVPNNHTIASLSPLFKADIWQAHAEDIWHCFYFYDDDEKLHEKLVTSYGCTKSLDDIKKVKLKDGYGNVSLKAIRNILPYLKKGWSFDKAVLFGGIRNAFGTRWERFAEYDQKIVSDIAEMFKKTHKEGELIKEIKEYLSDPDNHYGFAPDDLHFEHLYHHSQKITLSKGELDRVPEVENLRNPIVQQSIYEMRRIVNQLMHNYQKKYGDDFRFDRIQVEMGRDLKNGKKKRQEKTFEVRENARKNEEARLKLAEFGLRPSRVNIQKYQMWKEIADKNGTVQCPYTGKTISMTAAFGEGNLFQIEHILPYSISLDDGFGNKTLCESLFNQLKGSKTPYEFYQENNDPKLWGAKSWEEIEQRAFNLLPYYKAKRFISKKKPELSSFIERQLNDSRYIARKSVELLTSICPDVRVLPGQLTSEMRHLWGLNSILQPVETISGDYDTNKLDGAECYAIREEDHTLSQVIPKNNPVPETNEHELLVPAEAKDNKIKSQYFSLEIKEENLEAGPYWVKIAVKDQLRLVPKIVSRPESTEDEIIFKGKIAKNKFTNASLNTIKCDEEDGTYWARFSVEDKKFINTIDQKEKPKTSKKQLILFGHVAEGIFKSFIYTCHTNIQDGKYWLILDIDYDSVSFIKSFYQQPQIAEDEICITVEANDHKITSEIDLNFEAHQEVADGKYYALLKIEEINGTYPVYRPRPKVDKKQELIEGNFWVDEFTGDIKFDPKKNRDDHRHHAIDAIVIAVTKQVYFQRLSTYNAQKEEKRLGKISSTEHYQEPWDHFREDVKEAVSKILISFKENSKRRALTRNKKGYSVRGQLHKETVYGKRTAPFGQEAYHKRVAVTSLKNNKHIDKIVDPTIRRIILQYLREHGVDTSKPFTVPQNIFQKEGEWQLFLPNKRGMCVPIRKVRIKEKITNAVPLKGNINQHVNPRNNHHVLLYLDKEGNMQEEIVSFWDTVDRKRKGENIYKLPIGGSQKVAILEENDMFVVGLTDEQLSDHLDDPNYMSQYIYRVQKLSSLYYVFRHHLASTINDEKQECRIVSFKRWQELNPIKIVINDLGQIKKQ